MAEHDPALVAKAAEAVHDTCMESDDSWTIDEQIARAVLDAVAPTLRAEALREAKQAWQWGEWINAPHRADPLQGRLAAGQYVTDWLSARADRIEAGE